MSLYGGYVRVSRVGDRAETLKSPEDQEREIKRLRDLGFEVHVIDNVEAGKALFE